MKRRNWALNFARIAAGLAHTKPENQFGFGDLLATRTEQWKKDVLAITDVLEAARPNFDRQRFLIASGFIEDKAVKEIREEIKSQEFPPPVFIYRNSFEQPVNAHIHHNVENCAECIAERALEGR